MPSSPHTEDATPSPQPPSPKTGVPPEPLPQPQPQQEAGEGGKEEEKDPCRSEGCIHIVISDFDKMKDSMLSDPVLIRNLPWYDCVAIYHLIMTFIDTWHD